MTESADRRVRRTRARLHTALIELMLERDYERITVRDILDRADVGRSTFYAHFRDKDDLLLISSIEYLRTAATSTPQYFDLTPRPFDPARPPDSDPLAPIYPLLALAERNPEVYRALLGRKAGGVLLRATRAMVEQLLTEQLAGRLAVADGEFATTITFLASGVTGLLAAIAESTPAGTRSGAALTARAAYDVVTGLLRGCGADPGSGNADGADV